MSFDKGDSLRRLVACGLTATQSLQLISEIQKWVDGSGEEWTVARLKSLKVDYLRALVGLPPIAPWVTRHKNGKPKGAFGALWKFSRKDLFRCWNALMVSSAFTFEQRTLKMTTKQYEKFIRAVRRSEPDPRYLTMSEMLIDQAFAVRKWISKSVLTAETGTPLRDFIPSPERRAPLSYGMGPEVQGVYNSIGTLTLRPAFTARYMSIFEGSLSGLEPMYEGLRAMSTVDAASSDRPLVGSLSWIQEPGYKLRFVANPFRIYQVALQPLGKFLYSALREIPWDCTYDQEAGVRYCQDRLLEGRRSHCFDLSNATDNFPASLQFSVMKRIGVPDVWINFFSEVCHGDWNVDGSDLPRSANIDDTSWRGKSGFGRRRVSWTVGQPLGLYPSFAAFALTHHLLIIGIFAHLNKEPVYQVLGDDVVIFDNEAAVLYSNLMGWLGVPIAAEKTIESDKLAEFAGRVIFRDFILRGYKWRGRNDNSFIDVARNLGPRSLGLFKYRQRRVLRILAPVPEPLGFGWNPDGIDYWDRLGPLEDVLNSDEIRVRSYESRVALTNRLLYASNWKFLTEEGFPPELASDQEASEFLQQAFGPIGSMGLVMLPNVDYITRLIDDGIILPENVTAPHVLKKAAKVLNSFSQLEKLCKISELVRYERKLKLSRSQVRKEERRV